MDYVISSQQYLYSLVFVSKARCPHLQPLSLPTLCMASYVASLFANIVPAANGNG